MFSKPKKNLKTNIGLYQLHNFLYVSISLIQSLLRLPPVPYLITSHPSSMVALNLSHKHLLTTNHEKG